MACVRAGAPSAKDNVTEKDCFQSGSKVDADVIVPQSLSEISS